MLLILSFYLGVGGDYIVLKGEDVGRGEGMGYFFETGLNPVKGICSGIGYRGLNADFRDTTFSLNGFYLFYRYDFNILKNLSIRVMIDGGIYSWNYNKDGEILKIITITSPMEVDTVEIKDKAPGVGGMIGLSWNIKRFSVGIWGGAVYLTNQDMEKFGNEDHNEWFYNGRINIGLNL